MDHLNYFFPYERKDGKHEDQLTRAFLTTVKLIPIVQNMFIELIREKMIEKNCQNVIPSLFDTQSHIDLIETQVKKITQDTGTIVSVLISDDEYKKDVHVQLSERDAVYDGLIYYQPDWVIIIENKPRHQDVWKDQLSPSRNSLPENHLLDIVEKGICLSWRDIMSRMNRIIEKELVSGAEEKIMNDFLTFVDHKFSYINPYTSFTVCKDNKYLLNKKCISLMNDILPGKVSYHRGWKNHFSIDTRAVKQISLAPSFVEDKWHIELEFYTGDTMAQAKSFFSKVDSHKIEKLEEKGWRITPNFHFSYMSTNLLYPKSTIALEDYIHYWKKTPIQQLSKKKMGEYQLVIEDLITQGMMTEEDKVDIKDKFDDTNRSNLNVCPGIHFEYKWTKERVIDLDHRNLFISEIKSVIKDAFQLWDEDFNLEG